MNSKYTIYFTNFGYASERTFETLEAAIGGSQEGGFETTILCDGEIVGSWSIIGGFKAVR